MNLNLSYALCLGEKQGDQDEECEAGRRVDNEGPTEGNGVNEVVVREEGGKDGEAGHRYRQSRHYAAELQSKVLP